MKRLLLLLLVSESVFLIGDDLTAVSDGTGADRRGQYSVPAESIPESEDADPDAPRRSDAEPVDVLRYKLQEIKNRGKTITFCGKDGKRRELCRIQRISANGLTIWINGANVYIPYRRVLRLLDGVLSAPTFAWVPKKAREEEEETPGETVNADIARTSSVPGRQSPPEPELPPEIAFPRRTDVSAADRTSGAADDTRPRGIYFYNKRGRNAFVWKR